MTQEPLLLLGVMALLGWAGGKLFQGLKAPRVVGYILVGLLLGDSFAQRAEGSPWGRG